MQNLFSIGEIARIFKETTETFRHYDRVGLLKPHVIKENGYRYYSLDQFEIIRTILYLRAIGTPVHRIKDILHTKNSHAIIEEMTVQKKRLHDQIHHLQHLEQQAEQYIKRLQEFNTSDIQLKLEPSFYIIQQDFDSNQLALDPQKAQLLHIDIHGNWVKQANIISIISPENLRKGNVHEYIGYGLLSETPCDTQNLFYHYLPEQYYVIAYSQVNSFDHFEIDNIYQDMLTFIQHHNLLITGNAFERNILDLYNEATPGDTHYLKLYIPVEK